MLKSKKGYLLESISMKELITIQAELKAPKNQENKFGGYRYRSAEDILEAAKKVLNKVGCYLTISDTVEMVGNRIYIVATATLTNSEGQSVSTRAYAREEESKKGMDAAQITGSASSYARKYALNGLFCIDDTRDPDATNTHGKEEEVKKAAPAPKSTPAPAPQSQGELSLSELLIDFAQCNDRPALVAAWNKYKGTEFEEQAKTELRKRKIELGIEK